MYVKLYYTTAHFNIITLKISFYYKIVEFEFVQALIKF